MMKYKIAVALFAIAGLAFGVTNDSVKSNYSLLEKSNVEALSVNPGDPDGRNWIPEYARLWHLDTSAQLTTGAGGELKIFKFKIGTFDANFTYNIYFAGFICKPVPNAMCDSDSQTMTQFTINSQNPVN